MRKTEYNQEIQTSFDFEDNYREFVIKYIEEKDNNYSCYIPAYGLYYSCSSIEDIIKRGQAMSIMHFKFYEKCYQAWREVNKKEIEANNTPEAKKIRSKEYQEKSLRKPQILYNNSALPFILRAFDMSIDEKDYIIYTETKEYVLNSKGNKVLRKDCLAIKKGENGKPTLVTDKEEIKEINEKSD